MCRLGAFAAAEKATPEARSKRARPSNAQCYLEVDFSGGRQARSAGCYAPSLRRSQRVAKDRDASSWIMLSCSDPPHGHLARQQGQEQRT